jgi:hypothetical protein
MSRFERHSHLAPFPRLPAGVQTAPAISGLLLRPFGLFREDLEVDFDQYSRPRLVTQILRCCTTSRDGEVPDQDFFWSLSSGKRIECLVAIATLGDPAGLTVRLRCPDEMCRQEMEVEVSSRELAGLQRRSDETNRFLVQIGDEKVPVRVPTGRDQQDWLEASFDDEGVALKTIIETLLLEQPHAIEETPVPDGWVQPINTALEEIDPLVDFALLVGCPDCGKESLHEVDLQDTSLGILHRDQLRVLRSVHRLALHYHWSEEQIFDLPPWRYSHYLALIEKEESR